MRKFLKYFSFVFFVTILSISTVCALENDTYTNENGVIMTEEQISNLKSLQFTDKQIERMTQDEFDMNKDLVGELQSADTIYYKTTYIPNPVNTYSSIKSEEDKYITINEEVTEEEYNANFGITPLVNCGEGDSCWQNEYKMLKTTITKVGNEYRFRSDLEWNLAPNCRSMDVLAMVFNSTNISPVATSKYARHDWHWSKYDREVGWQDLYNHSIYNANSSFWRISLGGYSAVFPLKADQISSDGEHIDRVWDQSMYMYFNVKKSTNVVLYVLDVYGSYQHAQEKVDLAKLADIVLDPSAYNIINFKDASTTKKYDNMRKTHAQLSGISW